MKICPECGKVLAYNSYFGAYICGDCGWEDARMGVRRNKGIRIDRKRSARQGGSLCLRREFVENF